MCETTDGIINLQKIYIVEISQSHYTHALLREVIVQKV